MSVRAERPPAAGTPDLLEAARLPELIRAVCLCAGLPAVPATDPDECFVVRCGAEPPEFMAALLGEALAEDGAEVTAWPPGAAPDCPSLPPGGVAVLPGFGSPCPAPEALTMSVRPDGGRALLFAVERRDAAGGLLGVTWAALPEGEPAPKAIFRAAVLP